MRRFVTRTLIAGTLLGTIILGVGGRLAMAAIAARQGTGPNFSVGGTLTVIGLGALSGLAGSAIALLSRLAMRGLFPSHAWPGYSLFATLLLLVVLHGLRGSGPAGLWWFLPLAAVYGVGVGLVMVGDQSQRPRPRDTA